MPDRPSYLEVDTRLARGEALDELRADPEWADHLAATTAPVEVPAWARALPERDRRPRWWGLGLGALLAAALVLLLVVVAPRDPYVGAKGGASAQLYVERGGRVEVWDGRRPLGAGDRFRVAVADVGAPWFAIVYEEPGEPPTVLATGQGEGLVEGAWAFDGPAAGGRIVVVGSDRDPAGLAAPALLGRPAAAEIRLR